MSFFRLKKLLLLLLITTACSTPKDSFRSYYNTQIDEASYAIALPKWIPMLFLDREEKKEVNYFTDGMRRFKVLLYDGVNKRPTESFSSFADRHNFQKYLDIKKGDELISVHSKETEDTFKEIILEFQSDEECVIVGLLGSMDKAKFFEALKRLKDEEEF